MTFLRMLVAVLAAVALAAPVALAESSDIHAPLARAAAQANQQEWQSPDARDAADATTPSAGRPGTAGNPNVSSRAVRSALAQERYYMSYGKPAPLSNATRTVAADTGDGIAPLPFVVSVVAALLVGLGAGGALHRLHGRRRASRLAT